VLSAYLELLLLDATYKLTNVHMPVYVLLCVSANGESEVVGIFLTMACFKSCWGSLRPRSGVGQTSERWWQTRTWQKEISNYLMCCCFCVCFMCCVSVSCAVCYGPRSHNIKDELVRESVSCSIVCIAKSERERVQQPTWRSAWELSCQCRPILPGELASMLFGEGPVTFGEHTNNRLESMTRRLIHKHSLIAFLLLATNHKIKCNKWISHSKMLLTFSYYNSNNDITFLQAWAIKS